MRRRGGGLGDKGHAELHKKELRGGMRKEKKPLGWGLCLRSGERCFSESGQDKRPWSPVDYKRTLEEREESMQQVSLR